MSNRGGQLLYRANHPQFFRIIHGDSSPQSKLVLPRKFVRDHGDNISNWVILKVPSGKIWKIGITKDDGQIWLHKGWQDFVEYYSIVIGTLLVFQYDCSNCCFNVSIFDLTTTEIDYRYEIEPHQAPQVEETTPEIPLKIPPTRKRKEASPTSSTPPPNKINKAGSFTKTMGNYATNAEAKKENIGLYKTLTAEEKAKAIDKVVGSSFHSEYPNFMITMQPTYVQFRSNVVIPKRFVKKYIKRKHIEGRLSLWDGKTWPIRFSTCTATGVTKIKTPGWKIFARDCHLKVGDICIFEWIDPDKGVFRVTICRSENAANHCSEELGRKPLLSVNHSKAVQPTKKTSPLKGNTVVEGSTNEVPTVISGRFLLSRKAKEKSPFASSQPLMKLMVENFTQNAGNGTNLKEKQEISRLPDDNRYLNIGNIV